MELNYAYLPGETWDQHKARLEMADRLSTPIAIGVSLFALAALVESLRRYRS